MASTGGRYTVVTKGPLTGAIACSNSGGYWGAELKMAGWDMVIFEGASPKPVYLSIQDDQVELKDAAHLWGQSVWKTEEMIKTAHQDPLVRVSSIGLAGENGVLYAAVVNDLHRAAGRSGCRSFPWRSARAHRARDLEWKPHAVLQAAAIFVGAPVEIGRDEMLEDRRLLAVTALGNEYQLNTTVALDQKAVAIGSNPHATQVIMAWTSTGEDGANHSFAGVFESVIDVDRDGLEAAIARVQASFEAARVSSYGFSAGAGR